MTQPAAIRFRTSLALHIRRGWHVVVVSLLMFVLSAAAMAQDEPPKTVPPQIREQSGRIQYVGPDTFILLDAQGRPQPVPGMTYEDFLEAWKKSRQGPKPDATPRYTIESINFDGATKDGFAELDFVATVHLLVDGRVEVPLGLVGAILQGQHQFAPAEDSAPSPNNAADNQGNEELGNNSPDDYLTQNPDQGGVIAHLVGRAGDKRHVSLKLIVPLSRDGAETTLQLSCPRAVSSNLALTTNSPVADASVNTGTLLAQEPTEQGGTRLEVAGAVGTFRLGWHSTEKGATEFASVLSAAGALRVSIDGRSVRSDARLTVQSYGGGFDRFRVRLPPGAQLISDRADEAATQVSKYRVTLEEVDPVAAGVGPEDAGPIVLVEFSEKQLAPVTIELSTEQPIGLDDGDSSVELAGFEVLGAVRQFGDVASNVASDWQARWQIGQHVRQVDMSDLEASLQQPNLTAAFQYDRQPWSLGVRIESRQTRIHVTPQYELQCLPDEARLTLRLNYQVYGARAFEFRIRMEGWQVTGSPLESGGLVDLDKILRTADDTLTLPLAQASTPRAEITLSLRRAIPRDQRRLELPLPVPDALIATGDLIVRSTPDIELQPDLESSSGLSPVAVTDSTDPQNGNVPSLHFRTLLPDAVFVANRLSRAQVVSAEVVARITVSQSDAKVEQQFDYEVQHMPLKELVFEAANELWLNEDQIEVVLLAAMPDEEPIDGATETPLSITHTPEDFETTNLGDITPFRVSLPQPRSGKFTVQVRYRVPRPSDAAAGVAWQLPLVRAADAQPADLRAQVQSPPGLAIALDAKAESTTWKSETTTSEAGRFGRSYSYVAEGVERVLPLIVTAADFNPPSATTVDRIWLQTWFSGDVRQDRAAIRFRTAALQATVELPPQSSSAETEVLLDGRPADVLSSARGRIVVRLGRNTNAFGAAEELKVADHTLELRSRQPITRALLTRHRLTPPFLAGATALSQVYWQIVLPGDEHVIRSPRRMSSASQWQWLGGFWGQRPIMSQADLEKWVGASSQVVPAAAQNEYLYTGLASVVSIELVTAPRWLIVLIASSSVLVLGLLWIYVPVARQGWILAALACLIAGLAVAFPVPALLLAQAAALGVLVVLLSLVLQRMMSRPTHWPVVMSAGSSQRQVGPRTDSILMPPVATAASTAPTVPLRISDSQQ